MSRISQHTWLRQKKSQNETTIGKKQNGKMTSYDCLHDHCDDHHCPLLLARKDSRLASLGASPEAKVLNSSDENPGLKFDINQFCILKGGLSTCSRLQ